MRQPWIIAHRGASHDAPENTLPAFKLAWEQGADGIEGDFRLTVDGKIACLHDPDTGRVSGGGRSVVVSESTLAELRQVHPIPTLEEVLALVPQNKRIYIEIKSGKDIIEPIEKVLVESGLKPEQVIFISFVGNVISGVKKRMPVHKAHLLSRAPEGGNPEAARENLIRNVQALGVDGVDVCAHPGLDRHFVEAFHRAGLEVHAWTVDDPAEGKRLSDAGVDSITTNRPGYIRSSLG